MMTFKNTHKIELFKDLTTLLKKGLSLKDSLHLLYTFNKTNNIKKMLNYLDNGYAMDEVISFINLEPLFKQTFLCLFPIKGLTESLETAYNFSKDKEKWLSLLKKQWSYPLLLVTIMAFFTYFVKTFLLPEMQWLLMSFNNNQGFKDSFTFRLIQWVPSFMMLSVCLIFLTVFISCFTVVNNQKSLLSFLLKIPIISNILRIYYSLMFSFYFSKVTSFFDNFFEAMKYLRAFFRNTHLYIIFSTIFKQLNEGVDINDIIQSHPLFTGQLKLYFAYLYQSKQSLYNLYDYSVLTISLMERKMKMISKIILIIIYFVTGIYILSLYSLMILPVLELSTSL